MHLSALLGVSRAMTTVVLGHFWEHLFGSLAAHLPMSR